MRVLVVGGTGGIGESIAYRFRRENANVICLGSKDFNLADPKQIYNYFLKRSAKFDTVIYSAGFNKPKALEDTCIGDCECALDVNTFGFLEVLRYCLPYWKESGGGKVVAVASLYSFLARSGRLAYTMSKHALIGAVKTLALELAQYKVLVNAVSPGFVATDMTFRNNTKPQIDKLINGIPMDRLAIPSEIAELVYFLGSKYNTYITGQNVVIDGGYSIGRYERE